MRFSILQKRAFRKNIRLHYTAEIFERHRDNISFYFTKEKTIYWMCEIIFVDFKDVGDDNASPAFFRCLSDHVSEFQPSIDFFDGLDYNHPFLVDFFGGGFSKDVLRERFEFDQRNGGRFEVGEQGFRVVIKNCRFLGKAVFSRKLPYFLREFNNPLKSFSEIEEDKRKREEEYMRQRKEYLEREEKKRLEREEGENGEGRGVNDNDESVIDNKGIDEEDGQKEMDDKQVDNDEVKVEEKEDKNTNIIVEEETEKIEKNNIESKKNTQKIIEETKEEPITQETKLEDEQIQQDEVEFQEVDLKKSIEEILQEKYIEEFPTFYIYKQNQESQFNKYFKK